MKINIKKVLKKLVVTFLVIFLFAIGVLLFSNWKIPHDTQSYLFDNPSEIPEGKVALVLGTSKNIKGGYPNLYFLNRISAAKQLYNSGKVKAFVLSGDNGTRGYNEPEDMREALIKSGIPDSIIYLDYAGFRTLDSVVRMSKIFGQDTFIIVSQKFHNERAIFIAQHHGLKAYGYNAKDVKLMRSSIRTKIREKFARVKVFIDLITNKQPKYLGEPVNIK